MSKRSGDVEARLAEIRAERAKFEGLVRQEEAFANQDPKGYMRKVRWFGMLGYGYIFGVLLLVLLLIGALVGFMFFSGRVHSGEIKLLIIGVVFLFAILRSLWVKIGDPDGLVVSKEDAPELHREVNAIADQLQAPRPHEIRLNEELNASASQRPRLGLFGPSKNTLTLGMPLLLATTPDEARGVIAHEFGHFSGAHGKFGAYVYRLNMTWEQLRANLDANGGGAWLFRSFFNWFQPRFAATTFALRRANEYEADNAAAQVAGSHNIAKALMRFSFIDDHLNKQFWKGYYESAKNLSAPPAQAFLQLPTAAKTRTDRDSVEKGLQLSLAAKTGYSDTHPSLSDRLKSLNELPSAGIEPLVEELSAPLEKSAAEEFFGNRLERILAMVEQEYVSAIRDRWAAAYESFQREEQELAKLEQTATERELTEMEALEHANLVNRCRGEGEGEPVIRALVEKYPQNLIAKYLLGQILLGREEEEGVPLMEAALADHRVAEDARAELAQYHYKKGQTEVYEKLREEAEEAYARSIIAEEQAWQINLKTELQPHGESEADIQKAREALLQIDRLERAYLVSSTLLATGEKRLYLLVFRKKKTFESEDAAQKFSSEVAERVPLPGSGLIFTFDDKKRWYAKLDAIPGSLIVMNEK